MGTGAYFTEGDIPGIPDCHGRWVDEGERGGGREGEKGEVSGSGLTGSGNMNGHLHYSKNSSFRLSEGMRRWEAAGSESHFVRF